MDDTRRGFLKTLGKLTAAVGVTAAVATVPAKGKSEVDHETFMDIMEKPDTAKIAKVLRDDRTYKTAPITPGKDTAYVVPKGALKMDKLTWKSKPGQIKYASNMCVTNRKNMMKDLPEATREAQRAINTLQNMRLDHGTMAMNPYVRFDPATRSERIQKLTPYDWKEVFDLEWQDWKSMDPSTDTVSGVWVARVRPQYRDLFPSEMWYQTHTLSRLLLMEAKNVAELKGRCKYEAFRKIVYTMRDEILLLIKRDVQTAT